LDAIPYVFKKALVETRAEDQKFAYESKSLSKSNLLLYGISDIQNRQTGKNDRQKDFINL
jgi:hypothetical protein